MRSKEIAIPAVYTITGSTAPLGFQACLQPPLFPVRLGELAQCLGIEGRTREPIVQNKYINLCTSKNIFHSPMLRRA